MATTRRRPFLGALVLLALLASSAARRADTAQGQARHSRAQAAQTAPREPLWPAIQERYWEPFAAGAVGRARRTRDLAAVVTIRALVSAKQRLSTGWLPTGAGDAVRTARRSVCASVRITFVPPPNRQLLFVPLSFACSATCAGLLALASAVRIVELASRCAVSIATDLAQQLALWAQFATEIADGKGSPPPVPLPSLPPPEPVLEVTAYESPGDEPFDAQGDDVSFAEPQAAERVPAGGDVSPPHSPGPLVTTGSADVLDDGAEAGDNPGERADPMAPSSLELPQADRPGKAKRWRGPHILQRTGGWLLRGKR
jgi:hypothetical protein